jgi:hypothetical protein
MSNPWLKKNPYLSMWLSGVNAVANAAQGHARNNAQRQAAATRQMTQAVMNAWSTPFTAAAPQFLGMLPAMLENSAYHRANMERVMGAKSYRDQLLKLANGSVAFIPRRTIVQEAQGSGDHLWEVRGPRKAMAEAAWAEIKPVIHRVAELMGAV